MSDELLYRMLLEKPDEGCSELLTQYTGLVYALAKRRLGGICSREELEELCEDILFSFYQQREKIDLSRGTIASLLSKMTVNMCIDRYRKTETVKGRAESEQTELTEVIVDRKKSPAEQAELTERKHTLLGAVRSLGEPDSSIVIWRYYFGETASEIAHRLSMRTGTVEMRLRRALEKLRIRLGGDADAL